MECRSRGPFVNEVVGRILRSPIAGTLDGAVLLLTVRGRRSGRELTLPVQYAVGEDAIWVLPGHPDRKRWWRNLEGGAPVRVRLRGKDVEAKARTVRGADEPAEAAAGLRAYAARFPWGARSVGVRGEADDATIARAGPTALLVRLDVPEDARSAAHDATHVEGRGATAWVRRHPLAAYFFLAYAISWAWWIPIAVAGGHVTHFPGLLGPMFAALIVTPIQLGRTGLRDLLARMGRWRVPARWFVAAMSPFAAALVVFAALAVAGRAPTWRSFSWVPGLPAIGWLGTFVVMLLVNGFGEEVGWRGFAWPRLRERHTLGGSALILAIPWAAWHIPVFFLDTGLRDIALLMLPAFFIGMAAGAVVLGWLYERSGSSILIVALWHAFLNMGSASKGAEGAIAAVVTTIVILWAIRILRRERATLVRPAVPGATRDNRLPV